MNPSQRALILVHVLRILLGSALLLFGANGFMNFIPPPPEGLPDRALAFSTALAESGYMMQLIGLNQLIVGVLLLANRLVPLALVLLMPFLVNSLAFHLFLEPSGLVAALVVTALALGLAWFHRAAYRPLFVGRWPIGKA